jgi:hypothetical protein
LRTDTPTVANVIERAAALCDPAAHDEAVATLVERYEDDDRPARGVEGLVEELARAAREADPEADSPAARMTAAAASWLATNAEEDRKRDLVLRESARAAFGDRPPELVETWLELEGVQV